MHIQQLLKILKELWTNAALTNEKEKPCGVLLNHSCHLQPSDKCQEIYKHNVAAPDQMMPPCWECPATITMTMHDHDDTTLLLFIFIGHRTMHDAKCFFFSFWRSQLTKTKPTTTIIMISAHMLFPSHLTGREEVVVASIITTAGWWRLLLCEKLKKKLLSYFNSTYHVIVVHAAGPPPDTIQPVCPRT